MVVVYHAFPAALPGGFVGVDVFFVISGYLITGIIARDLDAGRFSVREFYERRVRRILPALMAVLAVTSVLAYLVLLPDHVARYGRTLASVGLVMSNLALWRTYRGGYFDEAAESEPLLHTWSLSVEEQFYVVFPLLMVAIAWWHRRRPFPRHRLMAALTLVGLGTATVVSWWDPVAAFYLAPARAWELAIGATVALWPLRGAAGRPEVGRPTAELVAGVGLGAVVASALLLPASPAPWQLVPACVGAAAIIRVGATRRTVTSVGLAWRPAVAIGLVSYSLYLWHWPLLVLAREWTIGFLPASTTVGVLAVAGALSWVTWRFVETPFRRRRARDEGQRARASRRVVALGGVALATVAVAGAAVAAVPRLGDPPVAAPTSEGPDAPPSASPSDTPTEVALVLDAAATSLPTLDCIDQAVDAGCVVGTEVEPTIALVGDSHAHALVDGLGEFAADRGLAVRSFTKAGCAFGPAVARSGNQPESVWCLEHDTAVLDHLLATPSLETIVVVGHWSAVLDGTLTPLGPDESTTPRLAYDLTGAEVPDESVPAEVEGGMRDALGRLVAAGRRVVIVGPTPDIGFDVPDTLARLERRGEAWQHFGIDRAAFDARNDAVIAILERVAEDLAVPLVRPWELFCDTDRCGAVQDGTPLYADDDHVNIHGARLVARRVFDELG